MISLLVLSLLTQTPEPLTGTWELDLKASSDLTPLFDFFEVGGLKRSIGKSATPTQIIDLTAERMVITIKAPFKNGTKTWPLDGKSVVEDDVLGNTMKATARYEKGTVVGSGTVAWKGADVPLTLRRFIENGQMVQELVLLPKGQEPIVNRRVFSKK
jgi:hypothetical protein